MINENIWMELLKLALENQSKGESLSIDSLVGQFSEEQLSYNLNYLKDANLLSKAFDNLEARLGDYELTRLGHDFIEKNGGLTRKISEKLNTVFIKINEEQFKALLIARIEKSELPISQKESIITEINNLPSALITHLATTLLDAGLENLPNALQSIGIGF